MRHLAITDAASEPCCVSAALVRCCTVVPVTVRFDRAAARLPEIGASPSLPSEMPDGVILCKWHLLKMERRLLN